ncbi:NDR1/HIN1-like protein 13 [Typha angustifolia]|uniref:NDR1/HIN1-like protein 13 n=1 Tax=Typha angustifolia TaxID=59011 RepID=UPI003C2CB26D
MADRVHVSKPQTLNGAGGPPAFPAAKSQLYQRPAYRPQPSKSRRRSGRSCCCSCFLWIVLILVALILIAAIAGGVIYVLYHPHRPTFSVSSARLSALNVSSSGLVTSALDLTVTARNPNKKVVFLYDPISVSAASASSGAGLGDGSFPGFVHDAKNTTVLKTTVSTSGETVDPSAVSGLRKSGNVAMVIDLETKAGVKMGKLKSKKIGITVHCEGIQVTAPKGKKAAAAATPDAPCKVKLRVKIWKWTL